jgi:RNA polymerase sigma-70 factor (ECF subfamily)
MNEDSAQNRHYEFNTTEWSLVLAAGDGAVSARGREALGELCRRYWFPLYAYIRRRVANVHDAQDLTQSFILRLLEKNVVAHADPARGRFRSFLMTAAANFLANERERQCAAKRGGGVVPFSLDWETAERQYSLEPLDNRTPERVFERQWAIRVLEEVLGRLQCEYDLAGKSETFELLKVYLSGADDLLDYAQTARSLGSTPGAVKVAVHRLRRRYRTLLEAEIGRTVSGPEEIDDEVRCLLEAMSS